MDNEKLKELLKDEAFVKGLLTKETAEEAQAYFEEHGLEFSLRDVEEMGKIFEKIASGEISEDMIERAANGELSEDELGDVAGGVVATLTGTAIAILIGTGVFASAGTAVGVFSVIKRWRW